MLDTESLTGTAREDYILLHYEILEDPASGSLHRTRLMHAGPWISSPHPTFPRNRYADDPTAVINLGRPCL